MNGSSFCSLGLPGYNEYRLLCGLPRAKHFSDLLDVLSPEVKIRRWRSKSIRKSVDILVLQIVETFELLYANVDDIDLYIAGISERPAPGALVGPTFQCIIADQFARLKRGDRYFYDLAGQAGSFTEGIAHETFSIFGYRFCLRLCFKINWMKSARRVMPVWSVTTVTSSQPNHSSLNQSLMRKLCFSSM